MSFTPCNALAVGITGIGPTSAPAHTSPYSGNACSPGRYPYTNWANNTNHFQLAGLQTCDYRHVIVDTQLTTGGQLWDRDTMTKCFSCQHVIILHGCASGCWCSLGESCGDQESLCRVNPTTACFTITRPQRPHERCSQT